jgi:hypothetical protein
MYLQQRYHEGGAPINSYAASRDQTTARLARRDAGRAEVAQADLRVLAGSSMPWAPARKASFTSARSARQESRRAGAQVHDEFALRALKSALAAGAWRVDPVWRRRVLITAGALLLAVGLFNIPIVLAPMTVRLLCAGALLYALVRALWAFRRA